VSDDSQAPRAAEPATLDVGQYCREVETHLTRVNGGHLIRIVGPAFDVVRRWAMDGVPLSVVFRGIETKSARHQAGAARRPLRIEFCDEDVRALFADWRRAVGIAPAVESEAEGGGGAGSTDDDAAIGGGGPGAAADADAPADGGRPSSAKDLERAIARLARAAGRLDWPDALREAVSARLTEVSAARAELRGARGEARAAILARVAGGDRAFGAAVAAAAPSDVAAAARADAERDLAPYRGRLAPAAWAEAVAATADRLVRQKLGLPQ